MAFRIGLPRQEFWDITPKLFARYIGQYRAEKEIAFQVQWEQARFVALFSIMPHSKKQLKPKDIVTFPWEESEPLQAWTELPKQYQKIAEAMDKSAKATIN